MTLGARAAAAATIFTREGGGRIQNKSLKFGFRKHFRKTHSSRYDDRVPLRVS